MDLMFRWGVCRVLFLAFAISGCVGLETNYESEGERLADELVNAVIDQENECHKRVLGRLEFPEVKLGKEVATSDERRKSYTSNFEYTKKRFKNREFKSLVEAAYGADARTNDQLGSSLVSVGKYWPEYLDSVSVRHWADIAVGVDVRVYGQYKFSNPYAQLNPVALFAKRHPLGVLKEKVENDNQPLDQDRFERAEQIRLRIKQLDSGFRKRFAGQERRIVLCVKKHLLEYGEVLEKKEIITKRELGESVKVINGIYP